MKTKTKKWHDLLYFPILRLACFSILLLMGKEENFIYYLMMELFITIVLEV